MEMQKKAMQSTPRRARRLRRHIRLTLSMAAPEICRGRRHSEESVPLPLQTLILISEFDPFSLITLVKSRTWSSSKCWTSDGHKHALMVMSLQQVANKISYCRFKCLVYTFIYCECKLNHSWCRVFGSSRLHCDLFFCKWVSRISFPLKKERLHETKAIMSMT